jgi:hypothetical protein
MLRRWDKILDKNTKVLCWSYVCQRQSRGARVCKERLHSRTNCHTTLEYQVRTMWNEKSTFGMYLFVFIYLFIFIMFVSLSRWTHVACTMALQSLSPSIHCLLQKSIKHFMLSASLKRAAKDSRLNSVSGRIVVFVLLIYDRFNVNNVYKRFTVCD